MSKVLIVLVSFYSVGQILCECPSDQPKPAEALLREKLFCNYNKNIRPVKHTKNQTTVQIEMFPLKIHMDENAETITVHGNIQYVWTDAYMKWDPRDFDDIQVLSINMDEIWVPSISIDAPISEAKLNVNVGNCLISYTGKVYCFPVNTINAYCSPDLRLYPFDTQNCSLYFLSPNSEGTQLNLNVFQNGVQLSLYRPDKVWELVSIDMKRVIAHATTSNNATFFPYLKCDIVIRRHTAGHMSIIVLPGLVIAGLTLLTFLMGDVYPSRLSLAVATFASNLMYSLYFGMRIPVNRDRVPLVVTFFRDSLIMSGVAIATAVLVRHLQKLTDPAYGWLDGFVGAVESSPLSKVLLPCGEGKSPGGGEDDSAEMIRDAGKNRTTAWQQMAAIVDRLMLVVLASVYLILFVFFLP